MSSYGAAFRGWLLLMALTVTMGLFAEPQSAGPLQPWMIAGIGLVIILKARTILSDYMGLREYPVVRLMFSGALTVVVAVVTGSFMLIHG